MSVTSRNRNKTPKSFRLEAVNEDERFVLARLHFTIALDARNFKPIAHVGNPRTEKIDELELEIAR